MYEHHRHLNDRKPPVVLSQHCWPTVPGQEAGSACEDGLDRNRTLCTLMSHNLYLFRSSSVYNYSATSVFFYGAKLCLVTKIIQDHWHRVIQFSMDRTEPGNTFAWILAVPWKILPQNRLILVSYSEPSSLWSYCQHTKAIMNSN